MRAVPGLVAKDGAEGVYVAALPDGRAVALKIADGGERARPPGDAGGAALARRSTCRRCRDADPRPWPSGRRGQRPRRRVSGAGISLVAEAGELRWAAFEIRLHALGEVGPAEALDHQSHRLVVGRRRSPACSWAYTWRFMIAIEVGDDVLGEIDDVLAGGGEQFVAREARLTSPMRSASGPATLRDENIRSSAWPGPTRRGSSQLSPTRRSARAGRTRS